MARVTGNGRKDRMLVMIEAVADPPDAKGARPVVLYSYMKEEETPRFPECEMRDARHAAHIVKTLCSRDKMVDGEPPRKGDVFPLWEVALRVSGTRAGTSRYAVSYSRRNGCPLNATGLMMDIYHAVKRILRRARKERK